ncbi:MAG: undecaprenyl-diphosphate phosphatase [Theionarchaea archaeon]|nr:undecaprenyl-diphosphate phosphatase [Theionarchaea archaeon]
MADIVFFFILGIVQGILEWLPVSSSGNITLLMVHLSNISFSEAVNVSFFIHAGTMLSVVVKFRKKLYELARDVIKREKTPFSYFYVVTTFFSGFIGVALYWLLELEIPDMMGSLLIAFFLVVTGIVIRTRKDGLRTMQETTVKDACIVGIAQGIAVIPGISRSGATIAALLSRGVAHEDALETSFLLSVPPVLGLMILTFSGFHPVYLVSLAVSFVFSLLSMGILLKAAKNLDFSWFCFAVALVTIIIVGLQST